MAQAAAIFVAAGVSQPAQTFQFPDGSMYRGEVQDGMQHGNGEWRSAEGDLYAGQFQRGTFEGTGQYADSSGNVFFGSFSGGVFHGVGTYIYADGRAERSRYVNGEEAGEGVRWSHSRGRAWRLRDGTVTEEISSQEAAAAALELDPNIEVPSAWYAPTADGEGRLHERISAGWTADDDDELASDGYIQMGAFGEIATRPGMLVAHSRRPLVDGAVCDAIVAECERRARDEGGWTTARHESYPTTDVPVRVLPETLQWLRETLLPDIAWPFLAHAFGFALPEGGSGTDGSKGVAGDGARAGDARGAIRVSDAFIVKYNASSGQRLLSPHRDGALFSFNVALNDLEEYTGGGTYFRQLDGAVDCVESPEAGDVLRSPKGHLLAHSSALMHGGHTVSSGVRYILVAFCTIHPEHSDWASRFYSHVKDVVDPGDEDGSPPDPNARPLPRGLLAGGPAYRMALDGAG